MADSPVVRTAGPGRLLATIGRKLTATFVGIALLVGAVLVLLYGTVDRLSDTAGRVDHTYRVLEQIDAVRSSLKDAETGQRGYLITGKDTYLAPYRAAQGDLADEQGALRRLTADNAEQQKRLDALAPLVDSKLAELKQTIDLRRTEGFDAALKIVLTDRGKAVMDRIRAVTDAMEKAEVTLLGQRQTKATAAASSARRTIVIGLILLLVGMAGVGSAITRQTGRRVARLRSAIQSLTRGDLTARSNLTTGDEFGVMGRDFDQAAANLQRTVSGLAGAATTLSTAAGELISVSGTLNTGAQDASGKASVALGAADLINMNVQSVASGAEEMSASIREIASTSAQAAGVATESVEMAQATSNQIAELGQASTQIGDVVRLITSIAEQTNLLALNATIEAARAGDAGKGFAVVASEVKDLAQETARATEDITRRIAAIQTSSEGAGAAVHRIGEVIGQIAQYTTIIAAAVEQQSATTAEMSQSVQEAARSSDEVRESFTAVAQITESTSGAARSSQDAADNLSALAADMNALVGDFTFR
jgi:methyl-accepting chemotaxis protein